jgi:DNA-binding CsgD family transcriptional regulator
MRGTAENQIKFISKKLIRSFFIDHKLDFLFSLLASDVYYMGMGKNMQAEGKKKVEYFITKAYNNLPACYVVQDKYLTKRIGWDHWLCEVICDLQVTEEGRETEQECMHETFIFRRCKDVKPEHSEWELIHIHNSLATKKISSEEMLAIRQANRTRRNSHLYDGLTEREKKLVLMLRSGTQIREIAAEFGQAEITIKKALAKLYHRYNVKNRSRLCAYFDAQENNY